MRSVVPRVRDRQAKAQHNPAVATHTNRRIAIRIDVIDQASTRCTTPTKFGRPRVIEPCAGVGHADRVVGRVPVLVADIEYREVSADGLLWHPSFRGIRTDKTPDEVAMPAASEGR
ncbi:hypothetical protein [Nocardia salmonicida]|uniref:ATP dependent DNA ligase n=1 Tax=Nocardia salmonicida TaxID=53431 RepID=UPI00340450F0